MDAMMAAIGEIKNYIKPEGSQPTTPPDAAGGVQIAAGGSAETLTETGFQEVSRCSRNKFSLKDTIK